MIPAMILTTMVLAALPVETAMGFAKAQAVPAGTQLLHTGQVFPSVAGALDDQVRDCIKALAKMTGGLDQIVRLHGVIAPEVTEADLMKSLQSCFPDDAKRPVLTLVRSSIEKSGRLVGFDAVARAVDGYQASGNSAVLPSGGRIDIAGQAEKADETLPKATTATLESLERTLEFLGSDRSRIVQLKAFYQPAPDGAMRVRQAVKEFFEGLAPPLVLVEWNMSLPIEIEAVAAIGPDSQKGLNYRTPPGMTTSPVYSRTAIVQGRFDTIYTSGLFAPEGTPFPDQAKPVFDQLREILDQTGSDMRHLTKATYYVSHPEANKSLDLIRPTLYDPARPPAASKAGVLGVIPGKGQGLVLDMIAVKIYP